MMINTAAKGIAMTTGRFLLCGPGEGWKFLTWVFNFCVGDVHAHTAFHLLERSKQG